LVGAIYLTSIFCQTVLGYSAVRTGIALVPLAVALAAATHAARHLLAHTSARNVAAAGLIAASGGAFLLYRTAHHPSYATGVLPGLVVLGLGAGIVFVAVFISATAGIPAAHAGTASGLLMTGHEIGAALGVALLAVVSAGSATLTSGSNTSTGTGQAFATAGFLALGLAVVAAVAMPRARTSAMAPGHLHMH
jgi:hypothetical protein